MSYRPGERWDRERFERASGRPAPVLERDYDEHDYYSRPGLREERDVHEEDIYRRRYPGSPTNAGARSQRDRVFFEEREEYGAPVPYRPRRESIKYWDDRETVVNREGDMVPYRERDDDREIDIKVTRENRPSRRPQFVRRQSSLDTFDRRPMPRYGDRVREEIVIPRAPRRRSPPRFVERDYEEIKVAEPEFYGDEEYRPYVEREVETFRRRYPEPPPREEEIIEEREEIIRSEFPKRGKTRMPRRLVNIKAIINLGYPYEEEGETIVIQQALGKEHIDEVIRISREVTEAAPPPQETRLTYQIEAPPPPPPQQVPVMMPPPPMPEPIPMPPPPFEEEEIIKRETKIIRENPSLAETSTVSSRSSSPSGSTVTAVTRKSHHTSHSHKSRSRAHSRSTHRSKSKRRHRSLSSGSSRSDLVFREKPKHSHETTLIIPGRERRSQRSLEMEIKALEAERKALKYEREAEKVRHSNEVILETEYRNGDVEIRKDRRGKLSLVRT